MPIAGNFPMTQIDNFFNSALVAEARSFFFGVYLAKTKEAASIGYWRFSFSRKNYIAPTNALSQWGVIEAKFEMKQELAKTI